MADKRPQNREFVRQEVVLPVKYRKYTGNPVFEDLYSVGRTLDLSSGGMRMSVGTPLKHGERLDLELELTERVRVYLEGRALGGADHDTEGVPQRIEKVSFFNVDEDTRDLIMKFIFEHQRKNLRRGLPKS